MDIRTWPLGKIMQMPDCCFGRRFLVSCTCEGGDNAAAWDISELALPEQAVIWEFNLWTEESSLNIASIRLALGDVLPTAVAQMNILEPVFPGLGVQGAAPRRIPIQYWDFVATRRLRMPLSAMGRRLVLEVTGIATKTPVVTAALVVSGMPMEIPNWLLSV